VDIGLCMTVRDEVNRLETCLGGIADLFAEIVIIDTGSNDGTIELLRDRFGITPMHGKLDEARCNTLADLRNEGYAKLGTPWIMCLDADERIPREDLVRVTRWSNEDGPEGFFVPWITTLAEGHIVEDYKLSLFRKGFGKRGLVHDNVQPTFRDAGPHVRAEWSDAFEILHFPEPAKLPQKDRYYYWRLSRAIELEPHWIRYYWFRGLLLQRLGQDDEAHTDFDHAFASRSREFPVECLNSAMSLVGLAAAKGDRDGAGRAAEAALSFMKEVADDFEVAVNFRLGAWFERALGSIADGSLEKIVPYDFAHGGTLRGK